jgi:hypothetical protein
LLSLVLRLLLLLLTMVRLADHQVMNVDPQALQGSRTTCGSMLSCI